MHTEILLDSEKNNKGLGPQEKRRGTVDNNKEAKSILPVTFLKQTPWHEDIRPPQHWGINE